jgi:hypothetical protein
MSNYGRQRWLDCSQSLTLDVPYDKAKLTGPPLPTLAK